MNDIMKPRYRIYRRQGGVFYLFDRHTGKRESLETADEAAAWRVLHAKNEAQQPPLINRQIARAYLAVGDPEITRRTWRDVLAEIKLKRDSTQDRWIIAGKDPAFDLIRDLPISKLRRTIFCGCWSAGGWPPTSFCAAPTTSRSTWAGCLGRCCPRSSGPKSSIGQSAPSGWEHGRIVEREQNPERRASMNSVALGGPKPTLPGRAAEDIDWDNQW